MDRQHAKSGKRFENPGSAPRPITEKDADDLVHSQEQEPPLHINEEDPDDIIHRSYQQQSDSINNNDLEDPDDRVHRQPPEDDRE